MKTLFIKLLRAMFGRSFEVMDLPVKFYKEANLYGTHGWLVVSHLTENLKNVPVRFVFVGQSTPPALTPRILEYIWEEAKAQGFLPHALESYGATLIANKDLSMGDIRSEEVYSPTPPMISPSKRPNVILSNKKAYVEMVPGLHAHRNIMSLIGEGTISVAGTPYIPFERFLGAFPSVAVDIAKHYGLHDGLHSLCGRLTQDPDYFNETVRQLHGIEQIPEPVIDTVFSGQRFEHNNVVTKPN